jgi:hypothetical protein
LLGGTRAHARLLMLFRFSERAKEIAQPVRRFKQGLRQGHGVARAIHRAMGIPAISFLEF